MRQTARTVALEAIRRVTDEGAYSTIVVPGRARRARGWTSATGRSRPTSRSARSGTSLPIDWALDRVATRPVARMSPGRAHRAAARRRTRCCSPTSRRTPRSARRSGSRATASAGSSNAVLRRARVATRRRGPTGRTRPTSRCAPGWRRGRSGARAAAPARRGRSRRARRSPRTRRCALRTNTDRSSSRRFARGACATPGREPAAAHARPRVLPARRRRPRTASRLRARAGSRSRTRPRRSSCAPSTRSRATACSTPARRRAARPRTRRRSSASDGLVVGADVHPGRVGSIRKGAGAARGCTRRARPGRDAPRPCGGPFDRILVDAPCSGLGSARRRPELLWRKRAGRAQRARADPGGDRRGARRSAAAGRPARLLGVHLPASRDRRGRRRDRPPSARPRARGDRRARTARPSAVRLWPHRHGSDGMFVAAFTQEGAKAAGYDGARGEARRIDPVRRPRASRRPGQARRAACRSHPHRHHGRAFRTSHRAGHGGGRFLAAAHRSHPARPPHGRRSRAVLRGARRGRPRRRVVPPRGGRRRRCRRSTKARAAGLGVGVTLNMETPVEAVFPYLDQRRRRDAHEHPAGVERADARPRACTRGSKPCAARSTAGASTSTSRSTAASRSTTPGAPSTPAPRC